MAEAPEAVRVLGVLAGSDMPIEQLRRWVESADVVVAADGGADLLNLLDLVPEATVGDLDSISSSALKRQTRLIQDDDQDTTDCDKLLAHALSQGFDGITLAGVEGDLLDHVIGTVQSAAKSPLNVRMALRRGIGQIVQGPSSMRIQTVKHSRLSVIPLVTSHGVTLSGTRWTLDNATLDPFGLTSLSNIAEGDAAELKIEFGRLFVFAETDGSPSWGSR